jgi:rubrerythrin
MPESERSLQMLAFALEKEKKGQEFYKLSSEKCSNALGRDLFKKLVADEAVHMQRIKEIYESLHLGNPWTNDWRRYQGENEDLRALVRKRAVEFGSKVGVDTDDLEAVEIALQMEQSAVDFYVGELDKTQDSIEKEFLTCMINEERAHFAALEDIKQYFTDPDSWFLEKEHSAFDGG